MKLVSSSASLLDVEKPAEADKVASTYGKEA